jgi:hypothetical protein
METLQNADDRQWLRYIETLRQNSHPVKIDVLLEKRMQTFIAMRNAKLNDVASCDS